MQYFLLTKEDIWSAQAAKLADALLPGIVWIKGSRGTPLPCQIKENREEGILISFLSAWIIPPDVLERHKLALNFHPGSSDYPGIGCYNFAIYEGAREFGATCHHMRPVPDTGDIVMERRFKCLPHETVEGMKLRTMVVMLSLFHDVLTLLASDESLPKSGTAWTRRPFTRNELNALGTITLDMPPEEIARRIRATTYPGFPGARLSVAGHDFFSPVPNRAPIA
jgi:methionyl-tRNA formyltransferase